jgi:hypothetical protein
VREINLFGLDQAGLIILTDSGIRYQNQTGGEACDVKVCEGVFAPMDNEMLVDGISYHQFFQTLSDLTRNLLSISDSDADQIDRLIKASCAVDEISIDRERLEESREAWLLVQVTPGQDMTDFSGFEPFNAVLTWPNHG